MTTFSDITGLQFFCCFPTTIYATSCIVFLFRSINEALKKCVLKENTNENNLRPCSQIRSSMTQYPQKEGRVSGIIERDMQKENDQDRIALLDSFIAVPVGIFLLGPVTNIWMNRFHFSKVCKYSRP